jgi:serine phosphatase RsbU (regulator of sigma subunit)
LPGDRLLFLTDGILDALSPDLAAQQLLLEELLVRACLEEGSSLAAGVIAQLSRQLVADSLPDDVTLVILEYQPAAMRPASSRHRTVHA